MSASFAPVATTRPNRIVRAMSMALLLLPLASAPAFAANFFEKLFGVQQAPAAASRPSVVLPPPVLPVQRATAPIRREKPKASIVRVKPGDAPARIARAAVRPEILPGPLGPFLRDPTLRRGDVVVTTEGLKVFTGQGGGQHAHGDFLALAQAAVLPPAIRACWRPSTAPTAFRSSRWWNCRAFRQCGRRRGRRRNSRPMLRLSRRGSLTSPPAPAAPSRAPAFAGWPPSWRRRWPWRLRRLMARYRGRSYRRRTGIQRRPSCP